MYKILARIDISKRFLKSVVALVRDRIRFQLNRTGKVGSTMTMLQRMRLRQLGYRENWGLYGAYRRVIKDLELEQEHFSYLAEMEDPELFDAPAIGNIPTKKATLGIVSGTEEMTVSVTSTGLRGGNHSHGGFTMVEFSGYESEYFRIQGFENDERGVTIIAEGDWEQEALKDAFKFSARAMEKMIYRRKRSETVWPWMRLYYYLKLKLLY